MAEKREEGTVKWFNDSKGYGFIQRKSGSDVFVHISEVEKQQSLEEGDGVTFEIGEGRKGECAQKVQLLKE